MSAQKQVKKITTAIVYGVVPLEKLVKDQRIAVMSVVGQAIGIKAGNKVWPDGTTRPWEGLMGTFKATNPDTGEVFRSALLFLPDVALIAIKAAMVDEHGNFRAASFAIMLFADFVPDDQRKAGGSVYEYSFESQLAMDTSTDPVARIEAQIAKQAALPAPGAAPATGKKGGRK